MSTFHRPIFCPMDSCCHNITSTGGCTLSKDKQCPTEAHMDEMEARFKEEEQRKTEWGIRT